MQNRILGDNHLTVSSIGLGCWGMSHAYGYADEKESLATLNRSLDLGISFLDTADVYGDGHNEMLIAKILRHRRKEAIVATKFGFVGDEHGNVKVNGRPEYVQSACDKSLKRLNIDVIDLYYYHRLDSEVPIEETVGAMADLIKQGKIRYIGLSEMASTTIQRAFSVHPITAVQSEYSIWHRDIEKTALPVCKTLNISLVPFSPLGRGFLTGMIVNADSLDKHDYRHQIPRFKSEAVQKNREMVKQLQCLAQKIGVTTAQLSLSWLLAQGKFIVPIPGMKRRKYIEENMAAVDLALPDEIISELNHMVLDLSGDRHNPHNLQFIDSNTSDSFL